MLLFSHMKLKITHIAHYCYHLCNLIFKFDTCVAFLTGTKVKAPGRPLFSEASPAPGSSGAKPVCYPAVVCMARNSEGDTW